MNQDYITFKQQLLSTGIFRHVHTSQYRCKDCPFCGDTKEHFYVKIVLSDDSPVLYNCKKCMQSGILNRKILDYYNIEDLQIPKTKSKKQIKNTKTTNVNTINTSDYGIENAQNYIYERLHVKPTLDEMVSFQYISNPIKYTEQYLSFDYTPDFNDRYWFRLTNGNINGRYINNDTHIRWKKLTSKNTQGMSIYNIRTRFDVSQNIYVYISEGIFDSIGLYYYNKDKNVNAIYISTLGKDYQSALSYLIERGIYGDSVYVKICKDNDVNTKSIHINNNLKKLFKKVEIYHNAIDHDYGTYNIQLEKCLDYR